MAHLVFALIYNGIVANIVVGDYASCDAVAKNSYGDTAYAVDVTRYPVNIGDSYHDGIFEREEGGETVKIDPVPTEADQIATLTSENAALRDELDAVSLAVLDIVGGIE